MIVRVEVDDELVAQVEGSAKARGVSFRDFVAEALRISLAQNRPALIRRFIQKTHDFGTHVESPWTLLAETETENYAAANRK